MLNIYDLESKPKLHISSLYGERAYTCKAFFTNFSVCLLKILYSHFADSILSDGLGRWPPYPPSRYKWQPPAALTCEFMANFFAFLINLLSVFV